MKIEQQNRFVRFILRAIEVFVGFYMGRRVGWNEEPFRKASESEKRIGGLFMAFFPAFVLAGMVGMSGHFGKALDSMMYQHSIIWLYVSSFVLFGGVVGFIVCCMVVIGPKTPLFVSVPIAVLMWAMLAVYAWKHLV